MRTSTDFPAVEQLYFEIPAANLSSFFIADASTWTPFLASVPGYGGKIQSYNESEVDAGGMVTVNCLVFWDSYNSWKSISSDELTATNAAFIAAYGSDPIPIAQPNDNGWRLYQNHSSPTPTGCSLSATIGTTMCSQLTNCDTSSYPITKSGLLAIIYVFTILLIVLLAYIYYLRHHLHKLLVRLEADDLDLTKKLLPTKSDL